MTDFETHPVGTGNRIEELEAKLARAVEAEMTLPDGRKPITGEELSRLVGRMQGMALVNERVRELEDKLEKAIEALIRIEDLTQHNMGMSARDERCVNREARAAIAELTEPTQ